MLFQVHDDVALFRLPFDASAQW